MSRSIRRLGLGVALATAVALAVSPAAYAQPVHLTGANHAPVATGQTVVLSENIKTDISAQGLAGSTAAGSQEFLEEGAWNKRVHPGWAGAAGITASGRAGRARVAFHVWNDDEDVELAASALGR